MTSRIIAGSRSFSNYPLLQMEMEHFLVAEDLEVKDINFILCGDALGADALGKRWAAENGVSIRTFPAQWEIFGKSAGFKRNLDMALAATHCIVFWNGLSPGSKHMIDLATEKGLRLHVVYAR